MARRASKKTNSGLMIAVVAGLLACLVAVVLMSGGNKGETGSIADFPINDYLVRGSQLRGNVYKISGRVEERFTSQGAEELVSLVVKNNSGQEERLPIIVPQEAKSVNVEREQEYHFRVKVVNKPGLKGLLYAESVTAAR